jgi:DNA polymerase-1
LSASTKTLFLIDGTAFIHRAYHAIRNLSNSSGLPTNAIFGFARMLIKLMEEHQPEYAVMLFDAKGPTFRHDMYAEYKANRPKMPDDMAMQLPWIKELTEAFNIPVIEVPGYEADDLMGTLARMAQETDFDVLMLTGDKDFMQLVTERTTIWDPMKDRTVNIGAVKASLNVDPDQVVDVMGLMGDASDNVPGVPGVGPKTAQKLIGKFGSMEKLYEQVDAITQKKLRENLVKYKEQAFLSKKLVTIDTRAPVSFSSTTFKIDPPDRQRLADLFRKLEFRQLQQTFQDTQAPTQKKYQAIFSTEDLIQLVERLKKTKAFAIDTETTSQYPMKARLVGISVALRSDEAFYIPCHHNYLGAPQQLPLKEVLHLLKPVLEDPRIKKIGQNIKYDWIVFERHGIDLKGVFFDTMLASYLINPSKRSHGLDQIALDYLNHKTIRYEDVVGKGKQKCGFEQAHLDKAVPYACEDADCTLQAYAIFKPHLKDIGVTELFESVEMPLVPVLKKMEMTGIVVDQERLKSLSASFEHQLDGLEDQIYGLAGGKFNIKSSQQLGGILFDKLKLPVIKKTKKKTGYSTDVEVLTRLADNHELPALVLRHRGLVKLKSTYADALLELINPDTGRLHTSYNQTVAATGRLSSSDPNLQNIPIRTEEGREIRKAFVPRSGWLMIAADYSQIELRILAHYADDQILITAFQEKEDIHTRTAAEVFQVLPPFLTPDLRRQAKVINFGIIYGMSAFSLSKELNISQKMAQTYIDNYFARYSGVKRFIDQTIKETQKTKRTSTLLGRIRLLPEITSSNRNIRQFAERTAVNTPIQGTAADLIKLAMIKVDREISRRGLRSAMLLTVHDELVFEVPPEELEEVSALVTDKMEGVWDLKVPLKVNIASGANWAEAH